MQNIKGQKTYQYIFNYFTTQILEGQLKLNDKFPTEREIAEKLDVSRNSVREVMHMLESQGLIECVQGSGNYVRCNPQEYMVRSANLVMALMEVHYTEIFHLRRGYEYAALKLAMENISQKQLERMHDILLEMNSKPVSEQTRSALDSEFHRILIQASNNRILILYSEILSELQDQFIHDLGFRIFEEPKYSSRLERAHWDIYHSLVVKDYQIGAVALENHFCVVEDMLNSYK